MEAMVHDGVIYFCGVIVMRRLFLSVIILLLSCSCAFSSATTKLISVSSASSTTASNGSCATPSISGNGRYVVFSSIATDLVTNDTNNCSDIFVRDLVNSTTTRISVSDSGVQGNGDSIHPVISADGKYIAYESTATNIVSGGLIGYSHVYLYNVSTGKTARVSVSSSGTVGNGSSFYPSISADGRYVAFQSDATNLVTGDTNFRTDVFVRDCTGGTTERDSVTSSGGQVTTGDSSRPFISYSGRYVVFQSNANTLVTGDTNLYSDIFLRDRTLGTTERVSLTYQGTQATGGDSVNPSVSADGRYVAFASGATNLIANDLNANVKIFVRDRQSATTNVESVATGGTVGVNGTSANPMMSADGAYVAFQSGAINLVANDNNGCIDAFIHALPTTGATEMVSVSTAGVVGSSGNSTNVAASTNGRYVAFVSSATGLDTVSNISTAVPEIYLRDRGVGSANNIKVAITSPAISGYVTTSSAFSMAGTASDDLGVTSVTWANSAGGSGTCTGTTFWTASGITLKAGKNIFTVTATDLAGNIVTASVTVTYDRVAPTVKITSPTVRRTYRTSSSSLSMGGTAADVNGISKVMWANLRGGSGTCTGTASWSATGITLSTGRNVITVTATDTDGGSTSTHFIVFYSPTAQKVVLAGTAADSSVWYSGNLSGWSSMPGKLSQVYVADISGDGLNDIVGIAPDYSLWYSTNESTLGKIPGLLKSIVAGDFNGDGKYDLAGLASDNSIWYSTNLSSWTQIPGKLSSLIVGDFAGTGLDCIAGLASDNSIWYTMDLNSWRQIPGKLAQIAAGDFLGTRTDGIVGIASDGRIWYSTNLNSFTNIPGVLSSVLAGDFDGDGMDDIAGIAGDGSVWYTTNRANFSYANASMRSLLPFEMDNVGTYLGGIAPDYGTKYTTDLQTWIAIPGRLSTLSGLAR